MVVPLLTLLLSGCIARERVCSEAEYPVWSVKYPETGGACVPKGEHPPSGYATYPPGLVPHYEEDILTCNDAGKCNDGPLAIKYPHDYPKRPCEIAGRPLSPP